MQPSHHDPDAEPVILPFPVRTPVEPVPSREAEEQVPEPGNILPIRIQHAPAQPARQAVLNYAGCQIDIHSPDATSIQWLQEFMCPSFQMQAAASKRGCDWTVTLRHTSSPVGERPMATPGDAETLECYTLDGSFQSCQVLEQDGPRRVLWDAGRQVMLEIDSSAKKANVVCESTSRQARHVLMRVVRELATAHALRSGMLHVHGAAVTLQGQTIMLTGPKRAGKTSSLLHALHQAGASLIGNDRLFMHFEQGVAVVRGMPTIIKIRSDALEHFPRLAQRYRIRSYYHHETVEESLRRIRWANHQHPAPGDTPRFSTAQLCDLFGITATCQMPVSAIVFPRVDESLRGFSVRPVSVNAAAERLERECMLRPGGRQQISPAVCEQDESGLLDPQHEPQFCRRLAQAVPSFELQLGVGAYQCPQVFESFIPAAIRRWA